MKTKLFTQNLSLELLVAFVLAFSVQGIAEAVKDPKLKQSSSDFFKFRTPNTTFSISSVSLPFDTAADSASSPETVTITFSDGITPIGIFQGETSPVTLTEKGGRDAVAADPNADPPIRAVSAANGNKYSFGTSGETNSTTITIKGRFNNTGSAGEQTVKIQSTGWTEGNTTGQTDTYTYYYYVSNANGVQANTIQLSTDVGNTFVPFSGDRGSGYATGVFEGSPVQIYAGDSNNLPVLYTNRSRLQMSHSNYKSGELVNLTSSGPIASNFTIHLKDNSSTDVVTAQVRGPNTRIITGVYIYGYPRLEVDGLTNSEKGGMENPGKPGELIQNAFTATVKDQKGSAVPGVPVEFMRATGEPGTLVFGSGNKGTLVQENNDLVTTPNGNPVNAGSGPTLYVRTNSSGKASVSFRLGDGESTVTVDAVGITPKPALEAYGGSVAGKELSSLKIREGLENNTFDLYALVTYDGEAVDPTDTTTYPSEKFPAGTFNVIFRTDDGTLTNTSTAIPRTGPEVKETPNSDGIAEVEFKWDGSSSNPQVTASLQETSQGVTRDVKTVTFDITGSSDPPPPPPPPSDDDDDEEQPANTITLNPTSISGAPGSEQSLLVLSPSTADVEGNAAFTSAGGSISGSGLTRTVTLPNTAGTTYSLTVSASGYTDRVVPVTVTGTGTGTGTGAGTGTGTLTISKDGAQVGTQQQILVRATPAPSANLAFTVTRGGVRVGGGEITSAGTGRAIVTVPTTGPYVLTVSATGYTSKDASFTAGATGQAGGSQPPAQTVGGTAESLEIDGSRSPRGTLAEAIRLRVRVLDANDAGVRNVRVTFRVLSPGQGTFAGARGSGRATIANTDRSGYATANFTPTRATSSGTVTVEAKAAGVTATRTFIIEVGEGTTDTASPDTAAAKTYKRGAEIPISLQGTLTFSGSRTISGTTYTCVGSGECVVSYGTLVKGEIRVAAPTSGTDTTPSRTIDPEVLMGAAQRPPMLWVDGGTIYALVGADVQEFATGLENVQNLAVSGNKVYYTEKTGENAGTINAMNLDGTGAKQLVSIKAVPKGIAVDSVGKRLYWTNSHGWIQSSNLQGTARRNVAKGLSNPMGIAVAAGKTVYWTEEGPSSPELLNGHTGQSVPGVSVAISGNTLYWTQRTGENAGTIHSVNLNGTGAKHLVSIKAVPMGITVDPVGKRLYWTNSHGWIQSSNLQGTARRNVAKGLGSPGGIALSANIKAPAATTPTKTTPAAKPNYDVDGSGTVDNADLFLVSLAVGTSNATYDVNGDGTVNDKDIALVRDNRDNGAAAAPMVVGVKLTAEQIGRLQAQIDVLVASNDRSPATLKTLIYLQQLIAMARPEKTQLLANYPNPFNPETWIPYELATDTNVKITIYNAQGVVIRTLQLGQQSAGYYTDRERAAYWDGRNALGEQVASGIYFYQLETDAMSALRKMVILK